MASTVIPHPISGGPSHSSGYPVYSGIQAGSTYNGTACGLSEANGTLDGAAAGATLGGIAGSVVPAVGTTAGAVGGGIGGGALGYANAAANTPACEGAPGIGVGIGYTYSDNPQGVSTFSSYDSTTNTETVTEIAN